MGVLVVTDGQRTRGRPRRQAGQEVHRKRCEQISYSDAANFVRALHFARDIGHEPNLHVTIQWKHAASTTPVPERIRRLLNNVGVWLRRRADIPAVWAYSREVGRLKGEHLHLMVYVPQHLWTDFRGKLRDWIALEAMAANAEVRDTAIRADGITPGDVQRALKSYFLKDGTEEVRQLWVRPHHKATGGAVDGKRLKVSHAIGPTARRRASEKAQEANGAAPATYLPETMATPLSGHSGATATGSKVDTARE